MRVLLTSPWLDVGGAERFAIQMTTGLAALGHEVGLAAPLGGLDAELVDVAHARYDIPPPERSVGGAVRVLAALRRTIVAFGPELVHAQNVLQAALVAAAVRSIPRRRPRVLATFHGVHPDEYRAAARLLRTVDGVACVSEDLRSGLVDAGFPARRLRVVRNAIDLPRPLSASRRDELDDEFGLRDPVSGRRFPVVVVVGRLAAQKAHDRFLKAAAWVSTRLPGTRFVIVGDGELRDELIGQARDLGLADDVRFALHRDDARDIVDRADLFVSSSVWEGLSIAALEALSSGKPIVATDTQGMRILLAGGAGEIVGDGEEDLGRAILGVLTDERRRTAMGEIGRTLVTEQFSLPRMVDSYVGLYGDLVSERRTPVGSVHGETS